jgi:hypothetical protein
MINPLRAFSESIQRADLRRAKEDIGFAEQLHAMSVLARNQPELLRDMGRRNWREYVERDLKRRYSATQMQITLWKRLSPLQKFVGSVEFRNPPSVTVLSQLLRIATAANIRVLWIRGRTMDVMAAKILADNELAKAAGKPKHYNHVVRNCNVAQTAKQARNFDLVMAHAGDALRAKGKNPKRGAVLDYVLSFYKF